jgi:hypothetical protein
MQIDSGKQAGIIFRLEDWHMAYPHHANEFQIVSPGGTLGHFSADPGPNYHELIFEIDAAWTNMTFTVIPPAGQGMTNSYPWPGSAIDKVWLAPECPAGAFPRCPLG